MFRLLWGGPTFILPALFVVLCCNSEPEVPSAHIVDTEVVSGLLVAPLIFAPTKDRFEVNAVAADGDPKTLRLFVQRSVDKGWTEVETVRYPAFDIVEWSITDLSPGTVYPYAIVTEEDALKALDEVTAEPREVKGFDAGGMTLTEGLTMRMSNRTRRRQMALRIRAFSF